MHLNKNIPLLYPTVWTNLSVYIKIFMSIFICVFELFGHSAVLPIRNSIISTCSRVVSVCISLKKSLSSRLGGSLAIQ